MSNVPELRPLTSHRAGQIAGRVRIPGDRSISHRILTIAALATGRTRITGLSEAADVIITANALTALGAPVTKSGDTWEVLGRGAGGLKQPEVPLNFGNSATASRLMLGVIAGQPISVTMTGDASLSRRSFGCVLEPLRRMGLQVAGRDGETLPLTVRGSADLVPVSYELPAASADIKSAILFAGLAAAGETTVIEQDTGDHSERLLTHFGADISIRKAGARSMVTVKGEAELTGTDIVVPGDPSLAAFFAAAALIVPDSDVLLVGVLTDPSRHGFYQTLIEMGADITYLNDRIEVGEPVADLRVRFSQLHGVRVPAERGPSMIDEYPALAVVAAFSRGTMRIEGLAAPNVQKCDWLAATAAGLAANGVRASVDCDTLIVEGSPSGRVAGGGTVSTHMDHRIAMAFLVMGLASDRPVTVDDATCITKSFTEFMPLMESIGARFS